MKTPETVREEIQRELGEWAARVMVGPNSDGVLVVEEEPLMETVRRQYRRALRALWEADGVPEGTIQHCLATVDIREQDDGEFTIRWHPPVIEVTLTVETKQ